MRSTTWTRSRSRSARCSWTASCRSRSGTSCVAGRVRRTRAWQTSSTGCAGRWRAIVSDLDRLAADWQTDPGLKSLAAKRVEDVAADLRKAHEYLTDPDRSGLLGYLYRRQI